MSYYFVILALAGYSVGIGGYLGGSLWIWTGIIYALILFIFSKQQKARAGLIVIAIIAGYWHTQFTLDSLPLPASLPHTLSVRLIDKPELKDTKFRVPAALIAGNKKILLYAQTNSSNILPEYGDILQITGELLPIKGPTNPGQFDYPAYLRTKHISGLIRAIDWKILDKRPNPLKALALAVRKKIIQIHQETLPEPYAALYTSLIFGDAGITLEDGISKDMLKAGLTHLIVVSGAQVALICTFLQGFLKICGFSRGKIWIIASIFNVFFYFLTGGGSAILRAIVMFEISSGLANLKHRSSPIHIMSATALCMLAYDPLMLIDIGAQLSFLATSALIFGVPRIREIWPKKLPESVKEALSLAFTPFLFTFPVLWYHFAIVSPASILSNIAILNLAEVLVITGFLSTVLGFVLFPVAYILNQFSLLVMIFITQIAHITANLPLSMIHLGKPHAALVAAASIVGIYLIIHWESRVKKTYSLLVLGSFFAAMLLVQLLPDRFVRVTFFDVGQGDGLLIRTPHHQTILIDTGCVSIDFKTKKEVRNSGSAVILPALRSMGINKIDMVILSHYHLDHTGGFKEIFKEIPVGVVIDNGETYADEGIGAALNERSKVPINARDTSEINLEAHLKLTFFHPRGKLVESNENNNSVVCKLSYYDVDFLFTGDLEEEQEDLIAAQYKDALNAEILKVGHHGSKTSSTAALLRYVKPQVAVISVGKRNKFGHPARSVIDRLESMGATVFRTDQNGAIDVMTDGRKIVAKPYTF